MFALVGDSFLSENSRQLLYQAEIPASHVYQYMYRWNLGDMVTGKSCGFTFDMRVVSVSVALDASLANINISPTFLVSPNWEAL